jgi:hypothetical protein
VGATTPEPTRTLPRQARVLFVVHGLLGALPVVALALVAGMALDDSDAAGWIATSVRAVGVAGAVAAGVVLPLVRWRNWRYELRDEEIDLRRGTLVITRTLIPTVRVQHVDTRRTWLDDQFGLRSVIVHTAGGSHTIPALRADQAAEVRDRIAALARRPDE